MDETADWMLCVIEWQIGVFVCTRCVSKVAVLGHQRALQDNHICADAEGWKSSLNRSIKKIAAHAPERAGLYGFSLVS